MTSGLVIRTSEGTNAICQEVISEYKDRVVRCRVSGCPGNHCQELISEYEDRVVRCGVQNCVNHRFYGIFLHRYLQSLRKKQCLLYRIEKYSTINKLPDDNIQIILDFIQLSLY